MRTIVVAEDDQDLRVLLTEVLEKAGYRAVPCENGAIAWGKIREGGVDMALLDLNMPMMNGLELCRRIRSDARFQKMPILMLTIRDLMEDQVGGYESGADDYLTKPFQADLLIARLKVLERRIIDAQ